MAFIRLFFTNLLYLLRPVAATDIRICVPPPSYLNLYILAPPPLSVIDALYSTPATPQMLLIIACQ